MEKKIILPNTDNLKITSLGCGCNGECFVTSDGRVYKELFFKDEEERLRKLVDFNSDVFIFPETLIYTESGFMGYLMRFVDGQELIKLNQDELVREFIYALLSVEKEVIELTKKKIKINDSSDYNIIYTKDKRIEVIDTDFYDVYKSDNNLYRKNLISISFGTLAPFIGYSKYNCFIDDRLRKLYKYLCDGLIKPSEFLYELTIEFEKMCLECSTVNEFNKCMELVRK